jgi:hypothetical protein
VLAFGVLLTIVWEMRFISGSLGYRALGSQRKSLCLCIVCV